MDQKKGLLSVHIAVLLFGLSGLFAKFINLPSVLITLGRVFFSSIFLFVVLKIRKEKLRLQNRKQYLLFVGAGLILAAHWAAFLQAIQLSTVAVGTLTFATFPLFVTFLEPCLFHEKLKKSSILTSVVMLVGILIIVPEFSWANSTTQGVFFGMAASLAYAVLSLLNRSFLRTYSATLTAFYEQSAATVFLLPFLFILRPSLNYKDVGLLILLGIVFTAISHTLFINGFKSIRVQTAGVISGLESVYSIIAALLLLHEVPSAREVIGGVIVLAAVFYTTLSAARQKKYKQGF